MTVADEEIDAVGDAVGDPLLDVDAEGEAVVETLPLAEAVDDTVAVADPLGEAVMELVDVADALPEADPAQHARTRNAWPRGQKCGADLKTRIAKRQAVAAYTSASTHAPVGDDELVADVVVVGVEETVAVAATQASTQRGTQNVGRRAVAAAAYQQLHSVRT